MIRRIRTRDVFADEHAVDLIWEYANECSIPGLAKICPQAEMYAALEATGMLQCFGAFDGEALVGFATVMVAVLPHYGVRTATMESLFIASANRRGGYGIELLRAVEEFSREKECVAILYSAPSGGQLERLLDSTKSCVRTNAIFCRLL